MKAEATLWFTVPDKIDEFLRATPEEQFRMTTIYPGKSDMRSYWTFLGTAEVTLNYHSTDDMQKAAVAGIDNQIASLESDYRCKRLDNLRERRSELLCLSAPKTSFVEGEDDAL